jgi:hypothetical protein
MTVACIFRAVVLSLIVYASTSFTDAMAEELQGCVQSKVSFDGTQPLQYDRVKAGTPSKVYLHRSYPSESCKPESCSAPAYLVGGNVVAVGKTCGAWAYVQYIGDTTISLGWVQARYLELIRSMSRRDDRIAYGATFTLTRGRALPVCVAYQQRLNQTEFVAPAFCGRPEDDRVPGFARLDRVAVSTARINALVDLVSTITDPVSVIGSQYYRSMNANGGVFEGKPLHLFGYYDEKPRLSTWSYAEPIDINNDGQPRTVLIWNTDHADGPYCGLSAARSGQFAFVMTADGQTIDQAATIRTFGHPDGGHRTVPAPNRPQDPRFVKSLRVIGGSYGVFRYRDLYYFDTFFDADAVFGALREGDFNDKRRESADSPVLAETLGVFLRMHGKTAQLCEYSVSG